MPLSAISRMLLLLLTLMFLLASPSFAQKKGPGGIGKSKKDYLSFDSKMSLEEKDRAIIQRLLEVREEIKTLFELSTDKRPKNFQSLVAEKEVTLQKLEKAKLENELLMSENDVKALEEFKKSGVRVGMMVDFYYQYDLNTPSASRTDSQIPFKNYNSRHNDFTLQLVEINMAKSFRSIDSYVDLDFGEMSDQNNYNNTSDSVTRHIGQAFLRYNISKWEGAAFTAGKFYTHFGYETPKTVDNRNYSRPTYYNLVCPFWHEGISFTKTGWGPFGFGLYVYDQTDSRVERNKDKTYGSQLNYNLEKFSATYNMITGSELTTGGDHDKRTQHEMILQFRPNKRWTLVADTVTGKEINGGGSGIDKKWLALVGYIDYETHERNKLVLRYEQFQDKTDATASSNLFNGTITTFAPSKVNSVTLTDRYNLNNGTEVRLEFRHDSADNQIFPKNASEFTKNQDTLTAAWIYSI
ncbi:MAG: outer membrane beta-barrel protein [Bacteriovoracaceae bacterium]|nr:outer membrane beta-barrel protein [Bacteriovoracaceae bacterium]